MQHKKVRQPNIDRIRALGELVMFSERRAEYLSRLGDTGKAAELEKLSSEIEKVLGGRTLRTLTPEVVAEAERRERIYFEKERSAHEEARERKERGQ